MCRVGGHGTVALEPYPLNVLDEPKPAVGQLGEIGGPTGERAAV